MSRTTNKFSPEVRARAVRMVLEGGDTIVQSTILPGTVSKFRCRKLPGMNNHDPDRTHPRELFNQVRRRP